MKQIRFLILVLSYSTLITAQDIGGISFADGVIHLSKIIADEKYSSKDYSDLEIVDSLFGEELSFYNGDISEALLALTFAALPFNKMPVSIPFIGSRINLKLPSVNQELFEKKRKNIPGKIYFDSSAEGSGDKDKLAHFFGNAFLAYNISFFNLSRFLGLLVELFEEAFKVSGRIDFRDPPSNHLGEFFGYSLRTNPSQKVSDFLNVYSLFYFSYN